MCCLHFQKVDPHMWGFPRIRGTILGVPIIRTIIFLGLILGSHYFGNLPCPEKSRGIPEGQSRDLGPSLN